MRARLLPTPGQSVFLFGPRGTGKSTWIRERFPEAPTYDLLSTREALRLNADPGVLYRELSAVAPGSWAVIDEVQKAPALLDEVHRLMEERGLRFVLSGSSARKLRRRGTNLLAGRAVTTTLHPFVSAELGFARDLQECLIHGVLPMAVEGADPKAYLRSYAETYLDQEVRAEALTRDLGAFTRFLEIAARQNGQLTNSSAIARDAGVSRNSVKGHFEVLVDTLLGFWLHPWKLKDATKQVRGSKFYFFDPGVARALSGRLPYPPTTEELGPLLETLVLHELRAYLAYTGRNYPLHFWRNYDVTEVDVLCETARGFAAIEIKATGRWQKRFNRGLHRVRDALGPERTTCHGVYLGERPALWDDVQVAHATTFLRRLWDGEVLP